MQGVNNNYDEIRIGTSLADVVPALTYENWAARYPETDLSEQSADPDGDGAADWYEVTASLTDPTDPAYLCNGIAASTNVPRKGF